MATTPSAAASTQRATIMKARNGSACTLQLSTSDQAMPDRIFPAMPPAVADMMLPLLSYEIVARADMLDETGRIAAPELAGGNILEHHGARGDDAVIPDRHARQDRRSEEHTSELQSLMRISSAGFCLKKKKT